MSHFILPDGQALVRSLNLVIKHLHINGATLQSHKHHKVAPTFWALTLSDIHDNQLDQREVYADV